MPPLPDGDSVLEIVQLSWSRGSHCAQSIRLGMMFLCGKELKQRWKMVCSLVVHYRAPISIFGLHAGGIEHDSAFCKGLLHTVTKEGDTIVDCIHGLGISLCLQYKKVTTESRAFQLYTPGSHAGTSQKQIKIPVQAPGFHLNAQTPKRRRAHIPSLRYHPREMILSYCIACIPDSSG